MASKRNVLAQCLLAAVLLPGLNPAVLANPGSKYSLNISISGSIVANGACNFNQGESLTVDFGEVQLQAGANNTVTMDGVYRKPLTTAYTCSGDSSGLQMKLSSTGSSDKTYNGVQVLDTDKGIVGIELLVNGVAQSTGSWFTVSPSSPPSLEAQLVQTSTTNSSNVTSGDAFTAAATLIMAFN